MLNLYQETKWCEKLTNQESLNAKFSLFCQMKYLLAHLSWCAPKLLDRLKWKSKVKTMEKQGVGARSLARNTLGVEGRAGTLRWD
jgi:hypothetical protein